MEKGDFAREFCAGKYFLSTAYQSLLWFLIIGNVGGLLGICLVYPLDTAKIRLQVYPHYTSIRNVLVSMTKADGVWICNIYDFV